MCNEEPSIKVEELDPNNMGEIGAEGVNEDE